MDEVIIVVQPQVTVAIAISSPALAVQLGVQGPPGPSGVASIQWNEVPAGTIDGSNVTFTLTYPPLGIILSLNGLIQNPGVGNDYTISSNTITFNALNTPHTGDIILATYTH